MSKQVLAEQSKVDAVILGLGDSSNCFDENEFTEGRNLTLGKKILPSVKMGLTLNIEKKTHRIDNKNMSQKLLVQQLDESKLAAVAVNLEPAKRRMLEEIPAMNANTICDHILAEIIECNIKDSTRGIKIWSLVSLSKFLSHKPFKQITREDLISYLNAGRKSEEEDPEHKWIGTYNFRVRIITKFFRWLYHPNEHNPRNRKSPKILNGIRQLPRKEKSTYRPEDMWTPQEQAIFLKYCPSKRDRAYVAMQLDTSARPHELLGLNISDLKFKIEPSTGCQYCEISVSGKTGTRTIPVIDSVPYLKEWLTIHPAGNNPTRPIFISLSDRNYGARLHVDSLWRAITNHKDHFKSIPDEPETPTEERETISRLLQKPFNPYVFRHSALTAKAQILSEFNLKHHAGWSSTSKMAGVYLHYLGAESSKALLEARGIIPKDKQLSNILQPKYCHSCNEPNTPHNRICSKCRQVLSFDGYNEAITKQKKLEQELEETKAGLELLNNMVWESWKKEHPDWSPEDWDDYFDAIGHSPEEETKA